MSAADRSALYESLLPVLRDRAWELGYALATHGSMRRDMDVVAVPWIPDAVRAYVLVRELAHAVGGYHGKPARKPLGRLAWSIILPTLDERYPHPDGWAVWIDISVTPGA